MKKKIADQPSFSLLRNRIRQVELLAKTDEDKERLSKLKSEFYRVSTISDRFNELFASRGWIAYESFSFAVMENALRVAKANSIVKAEEYLITYFDKDAVETGIRFLWGVETFRDRIRLIKLAYDDFVSGKYHACIPLLIMMIDGAVADAGSNMGFFSSKSEVTSWDSIAGNESGLLAIKKIFYKPRGTTNKNKITLPYRNGIMHGRDLGYANKEVAAKCWSLLFAVRDLLAAKKDQEDRQEKYKIDSLKTTADVQQDMRNLEDSLREVNMMDSFKRKPVFAGVDYPVRGEPEKYSSNSPERAVANFLSLWKRKNYGMMASHTYRPDYITKSQMAGRISSIFKDKKNEYFDFVKSSDLSSCKIHICVSASVVYKQEIAKIYDLPFRVLYCELDSTDLVVNPAKEGKWKIVNDFSDIDQIGSSLEWFSS